MRTAFAALISVAILLADAKTVKKVKSKKPHKAAAFSYGSMPSGWTGSTSFKVGGTTGVEAMQLTLVENDRAIIIDRVENNPLRNGKNPFWAAELDLGANKVRGMPLTTNSFCAGGSWMGDGTLVNIGGDPYTGYGAQVGYQAIRLLTPCENKKCQFYEKPGSLHMDSNRWYPATARISDGSVFILGGTSNSGLCVPCSDQAHSTAGNMQDNPTYEFYPKKGNGKSIYSPFMQDTEPWNLFAHAYALPDDRIFVASDNGAMILNWRTNQEQRLPNIPNNVRVNYPFGAAGALLPLTPANNYAPTVLLCGGTQATPGQTITSDTKASTQCATITLTPAGIAKGWQVSDPMPQGRIMGNFVMTPDGKLVLVNGAGSGTAGFFNNKNSKTGYSSADNPVKTPYLYDPTAPAGSRWINMGTSSSIARMYHSTATLLTDGRILVAGSNPNPVVTTKGVPFPTEYRYEYMTLPYAAQTKPTFSNFPSSIKYGQAYSMPITLPSGADPTQVSLVIMDLAFSTHGIQYNARHVQLAATVSGNSISFTGPPNAPIYPPGPAWMFLVSNGVPSMGQKIMVTN